MTEKLIMKWWFWVCIVFMSAIGVIFIVSMTYALHPTEIHLYANKEMVATTQGLTKQLSEENFNECANNCPTIPAGDGRMLVQDCWKMCLEYYDIS